jgi:ABC-2 type transport system permease protein
VSRRVLALFLRYFYLHRRSIPRVMEIVFWPVMGLLVWGFMAASIERGLAPGAAGHLIGAVILWEVLYRAQQSISYSITEEFWVRNIINLFISPLTVPELVLASCLMGLAKTCASTLAMAALAWGLYGFDLFAAGPALAAFFGCLLLFGWAVGLLTMGLIFRYGRAAEALIWGVPFLLQPFSAVFYPVDVLPGWMQAVARCLPSTWVFEGMRQVLATGRADSAHLALAFSLNLPWLALGALVFGLILARVRRQGRLSRQMME